MTVHTLPTDFTNWLLQQSMAGANPDVLIEPLIKAGWSEDDAVDSISEAIMEHARNLASQAGLPVPVKVPSPFGLNGPSEIEVDGQKVKILANLRFPRVVVLGNFLSPEECQELIELARGHLKRSPTVNTQTGGDIIHEGRTSEGIFFRSGMTPLVARIEQRIATLLQWPKENGEPLQILRYGPGAEYKAHYDYFDPALPGSEPILRLGGQRVATLVIYLNTPTSGGATTFPDVGFECAAVQGNAVFFSYDRPHPSTKSLHAGAPVIEGEKWVLTRWLRESPFG